MATPVLVNDVHSALNPTHVSAVLRPRSIAEVQTIVRDAAATGRSLAICGARHAMGGQQFRSGQTLLDLTDLAGFIGIDHQTGHATAHAGITWPSLIAAYTQAQLQAFPEQTPRWGIAQKQTGADSLTLGGALSANAHGRGLLLPPIVHDVESFTLVNASGQVIECSREHNAKLFSLAIGGYGLFGVIVTVTLRLVPRCVLRRVVRVIDIEDAASAIYRRIDAGFTYGDFQFDIDPASPDFLTKGVFSCYQPVDNAQQPAPSQRELSRDDWAKLLLLAHTDKPRAFATYAQHYLATDGQLYWSDTHQLGVYLDGYHEAIDRTLNAPHRCSEMITELYIPPERLIAFLRAAAQTLTTRKAEVIYGTIRVIQPDTESFLPWATERSACVIFNLHVEHTPAGIDHARDSFRALIDLALEHHGRFFLTYHRFATRQQLLRAYPQLPEFLARKRAHDPAATFSSDWYNSLVDTLTP